jgi:hypothetical protein
MRKPVKELLATTLEPSWVAMVKDFQETKIRYAELPLYPIDLSAEDRLELIGSLAEEVEEFTRAAAENDTYEMADAVIDCIYVLIGTGLRMGLPLGALFSEVHESNMEKNPAVPGTRGRKAEGGVSMKPAGWQKPRMSEIIDEAQRSRWDDGAALSTLDQYREKLARTEAMHAKTFGD